ncbi:MAG TPA: CsbD family protein [Xanthobacteraceae bacterium]|nr:CsbD family protein [Xanthobacteraceae bacterium]
MSWDQMEANWKQLRGKVKEKWGRLTDDDLEEISGSREKLEGKIRNRYGQARDQIRKDVDAWWRAMGV